MTDDRPLFHPPLDFRCFQPADWHDTGWMESFDGEVGEPVWAVTLGFARNNHNLYVKTIQRQRYDDVMSRSTSDKLLPVAYDAVHTMVSFGIASGAADPPPVAGGRQHLLKQLPQLLESMAAEYPQWNTIEGSVEGDELVFRTRTFGGWWVAFTESMRDYYIICHGDGKDAARLSLEDVGDIERYADGFDSPFNIEKWGTPDQIQRRMENRIRLELHPDYRHLMTAA